MGSHDLFKKRREERKQRKHEYKTPKANSFLIVTEGERTEPLYFRGIQKLIKEKVGGMVDVIEVPLIDIHGEGCATGKLIEITEKIVKEANVIYQNIWVVFDKDDYIFVKDIKKAIKTKEDTIHAYVVNQGMKEIELHLGNLTDDEREIILKGCLINYNKKN